MKVISILTKKELTQLPFDKDAALAIIGHLTKFKEKDFNKFTMAEKFIMGAVIKYVANASGATPKELYIKAVSKIESLIGDEAS